MDDYYDDDDAAPIVNRDEAIPIIRVPSTTDEPLSPEESESTQRARKRDILKDHAGKLKEKLDEYGGVGGASLQDRLLAGLMAQIIPPEELEENETLDNDTDKGKKPDPRSRTYVDRPSFSLPMMSTNFRRFNARIGIVFVFQNRLIYLFTWRKPTQTLSFLACYTLIALNPSLLPLVPLVLILFYVMIPSFLARHPAPANDPRVGPAHYGPPIAPPSRVKPAPELSKDFFRNMRDLQNSMEDFSRVHDAANEFITPYTNFSDEALSSTIFLFIAATSSAAFLGSHLVPWRAVALLAGWAATLAGHPEAQKVLLSSGNLSQARENQRQAQSWLKSWIEKDIALDEPAEVRLVEIFELQKHHPNSESWEPWLFSASPYDPLSPARIAGARAKGTQFFEEVQAPASWRWRDKKWSLDLFSREWVEQRMITGVEVETEGERWVYDMPGNVIEEAGGKGKKKVVPKSGWEEVTNTAVSTHGEWRRRRWVRSVERRVVKASTPD